MLVLLRKNTRIHKNGRNSWTLVLALSLVWFARATPESGFFWDFLFCTRAFRVTDCLLLIGGAPTLRKLQPAKKRRFFGPRPLQGAAQRGVQFDFILAVLRTLCPCSKMGLVCLRACTPVKGTPWSRRTENKEKGQQRLWCWGSKVQF